MTLNLDMDTDYQKVFDFNLEETAKKVIEGALDHENCPYEAEVNLVLTDNEEIPQDQPGVPGYRPGDGCAFFPHAGI